MKNLLLVFALIFAGFSASAQCTAGFTATISAGTASFTNTSSGSPNTTAYMWDFGDGGNSWSYQPQHTYSSNGVYIVCLTTYDSIANCSATFCDSVVITASTGGTNCVANFYQSTSGTTASFTNTSNGSNLDYYWDFGDGATSTMMDPTHTYAANGNYTACLTVSNPADSTCWDTYCDSVIINNGNGNNCMASFYWWPDTTGSNVVWMVNNSTGSSPITYMWDFGDNTTSTQQYPTHTYANFGSYLVCLTISDGSGCTSIFCDTVTVVQRSSGFTINVIDEASVGINEASTVNVNAVFPNPVVDNATVSLNSAQSGAATLALYDAVGKLVLNQQLNIVQGDNNFQLELSHLPQGLYIMALESETLNLHSTERLIKQ